MSSLLTSLKLLAATLVVCCILYPAAILGIGAVAAPASASGSLVVADDGRVVGSRLVGQAFTSPGYVWPRPSAVDYDASATGGSNLSPASPALRARAEETAATYGASGPVPADLLAASGSGIDPDVTETGALFQAPRVAQARGRSASEVERVIREAARSASGLSGSDRIVNVLELNLALDDAFGTLPATAAAAPAAR